MPEGHEIPQNTPLPPNQVDRGAMPELPSIGLHYVQFEAPKIADAIETSPIAESTEKVTADMAPSEEGLSIENYNFILRATGVLGLVAHNPAHITNNSTPEEIKLGLERIAKHGSDLSFVTEGIRELIDTNRFERAAKRAEKEKAAAQNDSDNEAKNTIKKTPPEPRTDETIKAETTAVMNQLLKDLNLRVEEYPRKTKLVLERFPHRIITTMAHDIGNAMTRVKGTADVTLRYLDRRPYNPQTLDTINRAYKDIEEQVEVGQLALEGIYLRKDITPEMILYASRSLIDDYARKEPPIKVNIPELSMLPEDVRGLVVEYSMPLLKKDVENGIKNARDILEERREVKNPDGSLKYNVEDPEVEIVLERVVDAEGREWLVKRFRDNLGGYPDEMLDGDIVHGRSIHETEVAGKFVKKVRGGNGLYGIDQDLVPFGGHLKLANHKWANGRIGAEISVWLPVKKAPEVKTEGETSS